MTRRRKHGAEFKREAATIDRAFKGSGSPGDGELARLKSELVRVKQERDFFCAKRQCSSPKSRPEISGYPALSHIAMISRYN